MTPERIAQHIADRIVRRPEVLVVDAFAGVGGNSIQLAIKGARGILGFSCINAHIKIY